MININYLPNQRFLNPEMEEIVKEFKEQVYKEMTDQLLKDLDKKSYDHYWIDLNKIPERTI